jgi:hypothetical protein
VPAKVAAVYQSSADDLICFLKSSYGHDFITRREKLDVVAQTHTVYRRDFAEPRRLLKEQVANLTHFPPTDLKVALPPVGQHESFLSEEASASYRTRMATTLTASIIQSGDVRHVNPKALADDFAAAVFDMSSQLRSSGPFFTDAWLHRVGVSRDRLPPSPTIEDVGYEVIFVEQMRVTTADFSVSQAQLAARLRKEQIPSWLVWEQVHRRMKQLPRVEIGNVNDQHIVGFGLYLDVLNVDKRIAELLRQAGGHYALLQQVHQRVPPGRGLAGLIDKLKQHS